MAENAVLRDYTVVEERGERVWKGFAILLPALLPVTSLQLWSRNPRIHSERQVANLASSLNLLGQHKPLVARMDGLVIIGNGTLKAAMKLRWTHVAAIQVDESMADSIKRAIVDNRLNEQSYWDRGALAELTGDLPSGEWDLFADYTGLNMKTFLSDPFELSGKAEEERPPSPGELGEAPGKKKLLRKKAAVVVNEDTPGAYVETGDDVDSVPGEPREVAGEGDEESKPPVYSPDNVDKPVDITFTVSADEAPIVELALRTSGRKRGEWLVEMAKKSLGQR